MNKYTYQGNSVQEDLLQEKATSLGLTLDQYLADQGSEIEVSTDLSEIEEDSEPIIDTEEVIEKSNKEKRLDKGIKKIDKKINKVTNAQISLDDIKDQKLNDVGEIKNADKTLSNLSDTKLNKIRVAKEKRELEKQSRLLEKTSINPDEISNEGKYVVKTHLGEDGKEHKSYYPKETWEKYFTPGNDLYNKNDIVKQAIKLTNSSSPSLEEYLEALNKSSNKAGSSVTYSYLKAGKDEGLLDTFEVVADGRNDAINEMGFSNYFDELFKKNNSWLAKNENIVEKQLQQVLPQQFDGSLFNVEQTTDDITVNEVLITDSRGNEFVLKVGKDQELFGGDGYPQYESFKNFISSAVQPQDENKAKIDDVTLLKDWRKRTAGLRLFLNKLENTPVDKGGIGFDKRQSNYLGVIENASYTELFGYDPTVEQEESNPLSDAENPLINYQGGEVDLGSETTNATSGLDQSLIQGGVIIPEDEEFGNSEQIDRNLKVLSNTEKSLKASYERQGLELTDEIIFSTAKLAIINKQKERYYKANAEKWIEDPRGLEKEKLRQGSIIGAVALEDAENQLLLDAATFEKNLAEANYNKIFSNYTVDVNNRAVAGFLFGDDDQKIKEDLSIDMTGNMQSYSVARDDLGFTTEDGYIKKVIDGEIKIQFIPQGTQISETYEDGQPVESIPTWMITKFNQNIVQLQESGKNVSIAYKNYSDELLEIPTFNQKMEIWLKNYNDTQETFVKLGIGGLKTAKNIVYTAGSLASYVNPMYWSVYGLTGRDPMQGVMDANATITKWLDDELNEYNFDQVSFEDIFAPGTSGWKKLENFGAWMMGMTAETLPIVAAMIFSGGSASYGQIISSSVAGLSSMGGKLSEMDVNNFMVQNEIDEIRSRKDLTQEEKEKELIGLQERKINKGVYIAKGTAYGLIEGSLAYVTTAGQISNAYSVFRGDKAILGELNTSIGMFLKKKGPEWLKAANTEGLGEVGVTFGTNIVDGRNPLEGMVESYVGGFALGGVFEGMPISHAIMTSNFATNAEIQSINDTQGEIISLSKRKDALIKKLKILVLMPDVNMADGLNKIKNKVELTKAINDIDQQITDQAGLLETKQIEVQDRLQDEGIGKSAGIIHAENVNKLSDLRNEASQLVLDNPTMDETTNKKLTELNKRYKNIQNSTNKLKSKSLFGHKWLAMKGKAFWNTNTRNEVNRIEAQAIENIVKEKGPMVDGPTAREIQAESMKILDGRDYDANVSKAKSMAEEGGWQYFNFDNNKDAADQLPDLIARNLQNLEAEGVDVDSEINDGEGQTYREYIEQQITEALDGVKDGTSNGFYDPITNTQYTFRENAINNQKPGVPLHETGHAASQELIRNNPSAFDEAGQVIVDFMQSKYNDIFIRMQVEGTNKLRSSDGSWDFEEVFASYIEEIAAGNIDPKADKAFTAFFAKTFNDGLLEASNGSYEIEFKGVNDITQYLLGLGKDIVNGKINQRKIDKARETKVININQTPTTGSKIAASKSVKKSSSKTVKADLIAENKSLLKNRPKNFKEKIADNVRKIKDLASGSGSAPSSRMDGDNEPTSTKAKKAKESINSKFDENKKGWKQNRKENPAADKLFSLIQPDLDGMIKNKAENFFTQDGNVVDLTKNLDLRELQQSVKTLLLADIRGFDPTNTSLYGYINGRLKNRIGDVLKSGEVFNDLSTKDIDNLGSSETAEINKTKTTVETVPDVNLRESLNIDRGSPLGEFVLDNVKKVLSTKMPEFKYVRKNKGGKRTDVTLEQVKKVLATNPTGEIKRQADRDLSGIYKKFSNDLESRFSDELRTAFAETFGSRGDYTNWLETNAEAISDLSIDKLVAFERLVKGEKIFTKVVKENLSVEEVKQFQGTGLLVSATTNQGPTLYKKLYPSSKAVKEFFDISGSKKGTRKDALADKISGELALNATMEVAGDPSVLEKFELGLNNSGTGEVVVKAYLEDISKAIGRGTQLKFSKAFMNSNADIELKNTYKNNNKRFVDLLKKTGVTEENVDLVWDQVFGDTLFNKNAKNKKEADKIKKEWKGISKQIASVDSMLEDSVQMNILNSIIDDAGSFSDTERAELIARAKKLKLTGSKDIDFDDILSNLAKNLGLTEGYAYEQLVYDATSKAINDYNKNNSSESGLKIEGSRGEDGGKADFIATVGGMEFNVELKLNKPRFGSVTLKTITDSKGNISFNIIKDFPFNDAMYDMANEAKPAIENYVKQANIIGKDLYGDNWLNYEFGDLLDKEVFKALQGNKENPNSQFQKDITVNKVRPAQDIADYYISKNNGTRQINIQGIGLYLLNDLKNPQLNNPANLNTNEAPYLGANGETVTWSLAIAKTTAKSAKGPGKYQKAGIKLINGKLPGSSGWANVGLRIQPSNLKTTVKPKYDMSTVDGVTDLINDPAIKNLDNQKGESSQVNIDNNSSSGVVVKNSKSNTTNKNTIDVASKLDSSLDVARDPNAPIRKIRVFDFDDTLATSNNIVFANKGNETIELTAEEFAKKGDDLINDGYVFDFTDFNTVRDGARGPLFDIAKKIKESRGNEDLFVLTARNPLAADAIYEFLKSEGLEFKPENIIGLGDSTGEAKAQWLVDKGSEGYNDFYFADDAIQNVEAVKSAMEVLDVKSRVQQAKIKFSSEVSDVMNDIIAEATGIESYKEFSSMRAKAKGRTRNSWSLIPPSAQDFGGLLYKMLAKGEKGDSQWSWMQDNLIKPFGRAMNDLSIAQNQLMSDFRALKSSLKGVPTNLKKKAFGGFTFEEVTRVAAWDRQGLKVDGLSDRDLKQIKEFVEGNGELNLFVDQLIELGKGDGYHYPGADWLSGTITTDFISGLRKDTRPRLLKQWNENIDLAFDEKTLNKLEAAYGSKYREAVEDSIRRMKTGQNRKAGTSRLEARFQDYINNSIGAVMFLNARSAVLQTISAANFVNWTDNNPLKAGAAFANQKQYWTDFMRLMNSDFLVDRRNGLKINVSESEIAEAAKTTGNSAKGVISYLLSRGFVLTQFADSFAIATGGSTYFRNRTKTYMKQGMSQADAEAKAFLDFREKAEDSQQSARADKISQQQASTLGRFILAFANTPSQYARIMDKAGRDLVAGRGDAKSNISKIMYYGFVQNLMFTALQGAMFASGFGDDEDEVSFDYFKRQGMSDKEAEKAMEYYNSKDSKKDMETANSMLDNILRGVGVQGVILATAKNVLLDLYRRSEKEGQYPGPEYGDNAWKLLEVSPPMSIKVKKYKGGLRDYEMNSWRPEAGEPFNINNPSYRSAAKVVSAVTNVPVDRAFQKMENVQGALDETNENWQRVAMLLGWPKWQLENQVQKAERFKQEKEGRKEYREQTKLKNTRQYKPKKLLTTESYKAQQLKKQSDELFKLNKSVQIDSLRSLGLTTDAIKRLKYEKDRVNKIIELNNKL